MSKDIGIYLLQIWAVVERDLGQVAEQLRDLRPPDATPPNEDGGR